MTETLKITPAEPEAAKTVTPEVDVTSAGIDPEKQATIERLTEARDQLIALLIEHGIDLDATDEKTSDDATETEEDDAITQPETITAPKERNETDTTHEQERGREFLRKMGGWALTTLEAQGIIPLRGQWHKRGGVTGFIAEAYVARQRRGHRIAGFLSPEVNAQLNGETSSTTNATRNARQ